MKGFLYGQTEFNLLKNAIEHSYEKGRVDISVFDNPLYTKVIIKD